MTVTQEPLKILCIKSQFQEICLKIQVKKFRIIIYEPNQGRMFTLRISFNKIFQINWAFSIRHCHVNQRLIHFPILIHEQ